MTKITYSIKREEFVSLRIFDAIGREVTALVNKVQMPGIYTIEFNGLNYQSGVYFYRLKTGEFSDAKAMILLK